MRSTTIRSGVGGAPRWAMVVLMLISLLAAAAPAASRAQGSAFVTRSGSQLQLNGATFRFAGSNIFWLGLFPGPRYPSEFEVRDALATASEMGANVVRAHTLGVSVGCSLCLSPSRGSYNEAAFRRVDYAIKVAGEQNIRLIIPLVDNYNYYHGGKRTFTDWRGLPESAFFTNATVIDDFKQYVATLLNRVNSYTGIAYKNDPTILAWETGNEISPPVSWTATIADHIKSVAPSQLVVDGSYGVNPNALSLASVDIYSSHFNDTAFAMTPTALNSQASQTAAAGKAFFGGEFAWYKRSQSELNSFLAAVQGNTAVAGALFWSLFPHTEPFGYVDHPSNELYTLQYPEVGSDRRSRAEALRGFAYALRGVSPAPAHGVPAAPPITDISTAGTISWRGVAGGDSYSIERAPTAGAPWTTVCDRCTTSFNAPWTDSSRPAGVSWYRVRAHNLAGVAGGYSTPALVDTQRGAIIVDNSDSGFSTTGSWTSSTAVSGYSGGNYAAASQATGASATWRPTIAAGGLHKIYLRWPTDNAFADAAPVEIVHAGGTTTVLVNQKEDGAVWVLVGQYELPAGSSASVTIRASDAGTTVGDAVRFEQAFTPAGALEVVVDNSDAGFSTVGTWNTSTNMPDFFGANYRVRASAGSGANRVRWTPTLPQAGEYAVYYWLPDGYTDRAADAPLTVVYAGGAETYRIDQRAADGGRWILLGTHPFNAGSSGFIELSDQANGTYVVADAVRLTRLGDAPLLLSDSFEDGADDGWLRVRGAWGVAADPTSQVYAQSATAGETLAVTGPSSWSDYAVQARLKITGEGAGATGAGIVFRHQDDNNYYFLQLRRTDQELRLFKKVAGSWSAIGQPVSFASSTQTWYTVAVVAQGSAIQVLVDGVVRLSESDQAHGSGGIGLRTYNTSAVFDDVSVRTP